MWRIKQFWISVDQCFNVLFGSGWADETLSAYCWRKSNKFCKVINFIFMDPYHCMESYRSEIERQQLPPEYRK
jgi:hypothetical protein